MTSRVQRRTAARTRRIVAGVVGVGAVVLAVALFTGNGSGSNADVAAPAASDATAAGSEEPTPTLDLERRDPDDPLTAGPVDAPVTLVVYSDYQCPFCAAWSERTLPTMHEYAAAGDLRIEWRDVNILSDVSEVASAAAYAAGLQGRFWDYHEVLFADGDIRSASELTDDGLTAFAAELGLDEARFVEDLAAAETVAAVDRNAQEGLGAGVFSTPAVVLDGRPMLGAQPTEVFVEAIEHALADGS